MTFSSKSPHQISKTRNPGKINTRCKLESTLMDEAIQDYVRSTRLDDLIDLKRIARGVNMDITQLDEGPFRSEVIQLKVRDVLGMSSELCVAKIELPRSSCHDRVAMIELPTVRRLRSPATGRVPVARWVKAVKR